MHEENEKFNNDKETIRKKSKKKLSNSFYEASITLVMWYTLNRKKNHSMVNVDILEYFNVLICPLYYIDFGLPRWH